MDGILLSVITGAALAIGAIALLALANQAVVCFNKVMTKVNKKLTKIINAQQH